MSFRKSQQFTLSPKARQDFIDILRYTGESWSEKQLLTYRNKIDAALQEIRCNPYIGRQNDLPSMHYTYLVGSHVIVYRIRGDDVAVVRILHQRMSLGKHV